jgi:hypothetical protein
LTVWRAVAVSALCGALAAGQTFTQRGYVDLRATLFPQTAPGDSGRVIGDALLRWEMAVKLTPWLKVDGMLDGRTDSHRMTEREIRLDWQDRSRLRPALSLRRASVTAFRGPWTLEAGKQFVRWGKADILNPLDRFAPKDFLSVVDTDFLGVTAVRATYERGAHTVDVVAQPRFTPSRTPLLNQRWVVLDRAAAGGLDFALRDGRPEIPGGMRAGARYNFLGRGFEYSLVLYEGHNHLPLVDGRLVPGRVLTVELRNRFPHMRMYGGAAAVPLPWFSLKGEAGYFRTRDARADDYWLYVVQAERISGEWAFVGGYAGEYVTRRRVELDFAPDRGLSRAFLGRASYTIDTNRTVSAEAAVRQNAAGAWLKGEYAQTLSRHWQARASFTLIRGRTDDFLGQYRRNSHAILTLRYSF